LLIAAGLALAVVGWEQLLHALVGHVEPGGTALATLVHLVRDSLLAWPLAFGAVTVGYREARRIGALGSRTRAVVTRAGVLSWKLCVCLAPGVAAHGAVDRWFTTNFAGTVLAPGTRGHRTVAAVAQEPRTLAGQLAHVARDAATAELFAFALLLVCFSVVARRARSNAAPPAARRARLRRRISVTMASASAVGLVAGVVTYIPAGAQVNGLAVPSPDPHCGPSSSAPMRSYNVDAINVPITLNRFGVHDPFGFMYTLDQNEQATVNFANAAVKNPSMLSVGVQDDLLQPLVIRANLGDCLTINLRNDLTNGYDVNLQGYTQNVIPDVSMQIQGVAETVANYGSEVGNNPNSFASHNKSAPNHTVTYSVFVDPSLGEGAHAFHSHGQDRELQNHGLFGSLVAEPTGSQWFDPFTGANMTTAPGGASGSQAMIVPSNGPSFREFVPIYHEVGDPKAFTSPGGFPLDINNQPLIPSKAPFCPGGGTCPTDNDPFTTAYAPCTKAINYRSECFFTRMLSVFNAGLPTDESQGYGSYTHGDPATPIFMAYLGDPMKTRLVNGGTEMGHVHHMHGGAIRWRRNPGADSGNDISGGLEKTPDQNAQSIRLDSQTIQPGETYNLEHECGAGGCQQVPGDFLFHCHIAHHYVAGMWGFYRTFDTFQNGGNATLNGGGQGLTLMPLPGRTQRPGAVTSDQLLGRTIPTTGGNKTVVLQSQLTDPSTQIALESLVENQLPPQGVPVDSQDAAVWNWAKSTNASNQPVYQTEPVTTSCWANFCDQADAGKRLPILFNPTNGRYAWPLLRPHLGHRPPFTGNAHTGAPWLGENVAGTQNDGLCPANAPPRTYNVTAVSHALQETSSANGADTDPNGQLFVLNQNVPKVTNTNFTPLAIRANVGDCVAVSLSSQLNPTTETGNPSKVNMHIHFVQFDPQASDGVITGLSFEQSIKPFSTEGRTLSAQAVAGATSLAVSSTARLQAGEYIAVGQGLPDIEFDKVTAINTTANTLTLQNPLAATHAFGESAGVEFVRYRWYPDVDSGTVFWHDHVDGIHSWGHGLFGGLVIEPPGCSWLDPTTGKPVDSGPIVDIACPSTASVGAGQSGSFREVMLWLHNDLRSNITSQGNAPDPQGCNMGSFNLRAEPFKERTNPGPTVDFAQGTSVTFNGNQSQGCPAFGLAQDPYTFSSVTYGDPYTPMLRAYPGDPVVIRTIGLVERIGALRITGHRFRPERFNTNGKLEDTGTTGISERFDYVLDGGAGGPMHLPGDYLYYSTLTKEFASGAWGLFRVFGSQQSSLETLPGRSAPPSGPGFPFLTTTGKAPPMASSPGNPCPSSAPQRNYSVAAFGATLPKKDAPDGSGVIYSLTSDEAAIQAGTKPVVPMVLRANAGDCLNITLRNDLSASSKPITFNWGSGQTRVGITPALMPFDPQGSYGVAVGLNPDSSVDPGSSYTYRFYADQELGTTVFLNFANQSQQIHGAYGSIVIEPPGSTYTNPDGTASSGAGLTLDIHNSSGSFREMALLEQSTDREFSRSIMDYYNIIHPGEAALNYTNAPVTKVTEHSINLNFNKTVDQSEAFANGVLQDPLSPVNHFFAAAGDPLRVRFAEPVGSQPAVFSFDGHCWPWEPLMPGSQVLCARSILPGETIDARIIGGAGGPDHSPGDWFFSDHRQPVSDNGLWGILTVCPSASACNIKPLG
jgi:hypothetical protein